MVIPGSGCEIENTTTTPSLTGLPRMSATNAETTVVNVPSLLSPRRSAMRSMLIVAGRAVGEPVADAVGVFIGVPVRVGTVVRVPVVLGLGRTGRAGVRGGGGGSGGAPVRGRGA